MENEFSFYLYYISLSNLIFIAVILVAGIESLVRFKLVSNKVLNGLKKNTDDIANAIANAEASLNKRRIIFALIGFLIVIWIAQRFTRHFIWLTYTYYSSNIEKLYIDLFSDIMKRFSFPLIAAFFLLGLCIALYMLFSVWQESINRRLFWNYVLREQQNKEI